MEKTFVLPFLHSAFVGFVALFPPVNPLSSALIVEPFLKRLSSAERLTAALTIAFYCFCLCTIVALFGGFFFSFFGISIPVVQLAGGFLISKMGLESLSSNNQISEKEVDSHPQSAAEVQRLLFFPLAFPTTTGGGTISVLLALSANNFGSGHDSHLFEQAALILASFLMCTLVCICYYFAPRILNSLSEQGHQVVDKLGGFLTFCVGLQIFVNGILAVAKNVQLH
ncbi:MAG TPA: MarC family protein [Bdellovibrio sp.]|uniref:MarC family protein n=1 Tax=Bdellovibrio sp. TaxID=28201 RepID=UPI002F143B45